MHSSLCRCFFTQFSLSTCSSCRIACCAPFCSFICGHLAMGIGHIKHDYVIFIDHVSLRFVYGLQWNTKYTNWVTYQWLLMISRAIINIYICELAHVHRMSIEWKYWLFVWWSLFHGFRSERCTLKLQTSNSEGLLMAGEYSNFSHCAAPDMTMRNTI